MAYVAHESFWRHEDLPHLPCAFRRRSEQQRESFDLREGAEHDLVGVGQDLCPALADGAVAPAEALELKGG